MTGQSIDADTIADCCDKCLEIQTVIQANIFDIHGSNPEGTRSTMDKLRSSVSTLFNTILFQVAYGADSDMAIEQLGLILRGRVIEKIDIGSPAYISMALNRGDLITRVNGIIASDSNINNLLVGRNITRSPVVITVAVGGQQVFELI
jgi:hypothetical protein